jgi:hypothetical protein
MGISSVFVALNLAACALGHGYIKFIGVDNKLYLTPFIFQASSLIVALDIHHGIRKSLLPLFLSSIPNKSIAFKTTD